MEFMLKNRFDAGDQLAGALSNYRNTKDLLVLALPRGGVPVAYEIARELGAELDILMVRKLGMPFHPELTMGAIASGSALIFSADAVQSAGIPQSEIDALVEREQTDLARREQEYRGAIPRPEIRGRTVILVDDGIATGTSMLAAIQALRSMNPERIVVAVPVAALEAMREIKAAADDCVYLYLSAPPEFHTVGQWYRDFTQVSDEKVSDFLRWGRRNYAARTAHREPARSF